MSVIDVKKDQLKSCLKTSVPASGKKSVHFNLEKNTLKTFKRCKIEREIFNICYEDSEPSYPLVSLFIGNSGLYSLICSSTYDESETDNICEYSVCECRNMKISALILQAICGSLLLWSSYKIFYKIF